jgi:hypothetical protein
MDIRKIMDRRSVQQKKGLLTDAEIQKLIAEWKETHEEAELHQATIDREVKTMEFGNFRRHSNTSRGRILQDPSLPNGQMRWKGGQGTESCCHRETDKVM